MSHPVIVMATVLVVCVVKCYAAKTGTVGNLSKRVSCKDGDGNPMVQTMEHLVPKCPAVFGPSPETYQDLRVILYTSDVINASSDDMVYITIIGTDGQTPKIPLDNPGDDRREGSVDTYRVNTKFVGTPNEIRVWGGQGGDGWRLNKVQLEWADDVNYVFDALEWICYCWFDSDALKQVYRVTTRSLHTPREIRKRKWKITTYTGDKKNGGSYDATWIRLHGSDGNTSGWMPLNTRHYLLQRGNKNSYNIGVLDNIDKLLSITVMAAEFEDSWYLEKTDVQTVIDGDSFTYVFPCHKWFNRNQEARFYSPSIYGTLGPKKIDIFAG